ncbi:hypothetical protein F5B20DRAFT_409439 [Whalleya microplaca]|nr:hypothetical protein F5B20DRAFT_409439 [Whalleya microplaca]
MALTVEAIVGIIGVVMALPPALLILWRCTMRWWRRVRRSSRTAVQDDVYGLQHTDRLQRVNSLGTSVYVEFNEGGSNHSITITRTPSSEFPV